MRRIVLVDGRAGRGLLVDVRRSESEVRSAARESDALRSPAASRRLRVLLARTGNGCASACFRTETRTEAFDSGAVLGAVIFAAKSDSSHTDSGAENGNTTSAIKAYAAARMENQPGDIFVC
jgi:hypothetical protein